MADVIAKARAHRRASAERLLLLGLDGVEVSLDPLLAKQAT
jgi:hypothetical protein